MHRQGSYKGHETEWLTSGRGAHGSKGRTSWSGRPELDDYTSFAAFFMHYMYYLRSGVTKSALATSDQSPTPSDGAGSSVVILGGYSYGSLILKHLPPIPMILHPFDKPIVGSSHDEILTRAHKLAQQSTLVWTNSARSKERESRTRRKGHESKPSVTIGGEETTPEKRRTSRDIRRSVDRGLSAELGNRLRSLSHSHRRSRDDSLPIPLETAERAPITMPAVRYLLVSPLTPPISTLAAPVLGHKFWNKSKGDYEDVIGLHTTLAIYGDQDVFTSAKRTRDWSKQLKAMPGSQFSSVEVAEAGHFWVESGVEGKLRDALRCWEAGVR
jgi:hypothetical protein